MDEEEQQQDQKQKQYSIQQKNNINKVSDQQKDQVPIQEQQPQQQWFDEDDQPYTCGDRLTSKDFISNLFTFIIMIIGIILRIQQDDKEDRQTVGGYFLAFGVFGFAGGITNWIAVKMLFDDVPLIYGSGVIPNRFLEIRAAIKRMMMRSFFDEAYLKKYLSNKIGEFFVQIDIKSKIENYLKSDSFEEVLKQEIDKLLKTPQGMMIGMLAGGSSDGLVKLIKPMLGSMSGIATPILKEALSSEEFLEIPKIRNQINMMLEDKLQELTADVVKKMMEDVMRKHLGWLVVWGNVFGSLLGVIAHICTVYIGIP